MKHVFETSQVAHIWAHQSQNEGRNAGNNFYFKGQTIYSYGSHFPIATIVGHDVLLTMRTYSNTTSGHVWNVKGAISHKNIIYCYDVPTIYGQSTLAKDNKAGYLKTTHANNLNRWKQEIKSLFDELGNKRIRDVQSRINAINEHINKLQTYCNYFKIKIADKELKGLLKLVQSDNFIESARIAKEKANKMIERQNEAKENKLKLAAKTYTQYIKLWRENDSEAITNLPDKIKSLVNFYRNTGNAFTHLRYNKGENRIETSKGIQIPCDIAKRAFIRLNGCMEGSCNELNIPVMSYTITKTDKETITAGCHTIPKSDIKYIAQLLNW